MRPRDLYPADAAEFSHILGGVHRALDTSIRLPAWPFLAPNGEADICQFSRAIEGPFAAVLQALVDAHGDAEIALVALEPSPDYYRANYGSFPAFRSRGEEVRKNYWAAVSYEPAGDPTGSLAYTANTVGIVGSTGRWAVWAERAWDLAIVLSQVADGPWRSVGVDFVPAQSALASFTEPDFKVSLSDEARTTFLENVHRRGCLR